MGLTAGNIVEVLGVIAERIAGEKDYITELDAVLGDGDHWVNMNKGYQALVAKKDELARMSPSELFKSVGMTLMASIGGSSGALYGSAFIMSHNQLKDVEDIDLEKGCDVMESCLQAIMHRGKAKAGDKTMIDPLAEAVAAYRSALADGKDSAGCMKDMVDGARRGMEATKDMPAMKGRATYQTEKGVGHIDAGAVTMFYTLEAFGNWITKA